jgi:hypothetical protein
MRSIRQRALTLVVALAPVAYLILETAPRTRI